MKEQTANHFWSLRSASFFYRYFAYVDTEEYYADSLLIRREVTVQFMQEYSHSNWPYIVIFCRVKKRDSQRLLDALAQLPNKMLLCGRLDYPAFCMELSQKMSDGAEELRKGVRRQRCSVIYRF